MYLGIIILSIVVALARKGQLKKAQSFKINLWYLLVIALFVYIALIAGTIGNAAFVKNYSYWLYFIVYVLVMVTIVFNLNNIWSYLLVLGVALNFTATFLNGGKMPILQSAVDMAGSNFPAFLKVFGATNQLSASTPYVMPLCRIIGVPGLPISIGDLIVSVALFMVVQLFFVQPAAKKATPKDIADYTGKLNFTNELKIDEIIQAAGEESIDELDSYLTSSRKPDLALEDDIILGDDEGSIDLHKEHLVSSAADDMILGQDATKALSYQQRQELEKSLSTPDEEEREEDITLLPASSDSLVEEDDEDYEEMLRVLDEIKHRQDQPSQPAEDTQPTAIDESSFIDELGAEAGIVADDIVEEISDEDQSNLDELLNELEQQAGSKFEEVEEPVVDAPVSETEEVADLATEEITEEEPIEALGVVEEELEQTTEVPVEVLGEIQMPSEEDVALDEGEAIAYLPEEDNAEALAAEAQAAQELQKNADAMLQYMSDLFVQNKQEQAAAISAAPTVEEDQLVEEIVETTTDEDVFAAAEPEPTHYEQPAAAAEAMEEVLPQAKEEPAPQAPAAEETPDEEDDEDDDSVYPFIIENGRIVENKNYKFQKGKDAEQKNLDIEKDAPSIYDSTVNLENIRKEIFEELQRQEQEALSPLASAAQGQAEDAPQEPTADLDTISAKEGAPHRSKEAKSALAKDATNEYERVAFEIDGEINYVWIKK